MRYINKWLDLILIIISSVCLIVEAAQIPVYSDATQSIVVTNKAPEFIIQIKANPTTGYTWSTQSYDKNLLTLESYKFVPPNVNLIGAGGVSVWKFKVNPQALTQSFKTQIHLLYARSWDLSDNPSAVVFTVSH